MGIMTDKYSVCAGIPFYKNTDPTHFKLSVDSIINQTYPIKEIHLIQDGPITEELNKMVFNYKENHNNIIHIVIKENKGLAHALNCSILKSTSNYYLRMDSDDISVKHRLDILMKSIKKDDNIDVLGSTITEFYGDTLEKSIENDELKTLQVPNNLKDIKRAFHYKAPMFHVSVIFKKDVFALSGLYNSKYRRTQDLELWSRMLKKDITLKNIDDSLVYVRAQDFAKSRSNFKSIFRQAKIRYKYNTWSPWLNILKISSILFRFLPRRLREFVYRKRR